MAAAVGSGNRETKSKSDGSSGDVDPAEGQGGGVTGDGKMVEAMKKEEDEKGVRTETCLKLFMRRIADCLVGADTLPQKPNDASVNLDSLVGYFQTEEEPREVQDLALASLMYPSAIYLVPSTNPPLTVLGVFVAQCP